MRIRPVLTTLFVGFMLVIGVDYTSFATTGQSLILGRGNSASATTTLERTTRGAALTLRTRPGSPPLAVDQSQKVSHLNADLLDGLDSSALRTTASTMQTTGGTTAAGQHRTWTTPVLPGGTYVVRYFAVVTVAGKPGLDLACDVQERNPQKPEWSSEIMSSSGTTDAGGNVDLDLTSFPLAIAAGDTIAIDCTDPYSPDTFTVSGELGLEHFDHATTLTATAANS